MKLDGITATLTPKVGLKAVERALRASISHTSGVQVGLREDLVHVGCGFAGWSLRGIRIGSFGKNAVYKRTTLGIRPGSSPAIQTAASKSSTASCCI